MSKDSRHLGVVQSSHNTSKNPDTKSFKYSLELFARSAELVERVAGTPAGPEPSHSLHQSLHRTLRTTRRAENL